jgi:glutamate synthase domain-containing protein 2/glutamate synthase domain-containing protein 1/glutamate synthase domain-containing protein 3
MTEASPRHPDQSRGGRPHGANRPQAQGLYDPRFEHDACGVGFVCHVKGEASHDIIDMSVELLNNLDHRGACGCDPNTGDGAGILVSMPDKFLRRVCWEECGFHLPPKGDYAAATLFLPPDDNERMQHEILLEKLINDYDMNLLGWRDVPVRSEVLGFVSRSSEPRIRQVFVGMRSSFYNRRDFERRLYLVRHRVENMSEQLKMPGNEYFYVCTLSTNRMVYKGMLRTKQLVEYFPDLSDPDFESHLGLVHSRFSTNTFPAWFLAHPYRYLAHNGEINALRGNRNWMRARQGSLHSSVFGAELDRLWPLFSESVSDSATLDSALQFLVLNGRSLAHAVLMLIPEAWDKHDLMDPELKAFYEYHACLMEPWDGPAAIAFTNGESIGAVLDRNGLRPARYIETTDDIVVMASEVGVLPDIPASRIRRKWRLQPGRIFLVDTKQGRIVGDEEIKREMVNMRPWRRWLDENLVTLESLRAHPEDVQHPDHDTLITRQLAFGYTNEELRILVQPMAATGKESIGSMGSDTPLACLSDRPQLLYNYFQQLFAQVTNPPLDAIREELVTSLVTYLGREGNLIDETPAACRLVKLTSPIITNDQLEKLRRINEKGMKARTLTMLYKVSESEAGLRKALDVLRDEAAEAVREGYCLLVLSDRGVDEEHAPIPSLLATSAVHHHLIREGTRTQTGLIIETGDAREVHHFCMLLGFGAGAINPYLALESISEMHREGLFDPKYDLRALWANYVHAVDAGILKVASKMGISTVQSYRGAQIFEAIGLNKTFVDEFFTNTASRINGVGLDVIEQECALRHRKAFPPIHAGPQLLETGGNYQWRQDGERHQWNPATLAKMQHAVRINSYETYREYADLVNQESRARLTLRGLMSFRKREPIPIEEVEPAKNIVKRFCTGAMSLGALSREAHETLAIAMNRIGGMSNSGEGGEDPVRFKPDDENTFRRSAIKQVASGRFGVTAEYLANADQIQIKMAQGAKPGEGGQLPGHKVDDYIARIRYSTPGVGLISPPPHHDIYSIEDLAQLIHDLKNVNPEAQVSVKLVSEVGVGTVAAGVSKGKADHILISGDGGGTGASPLTSIKHAGIPWELGLSETQQTLVLNDLRGRVRLQVDGQLKTGRDVVIGALLGAEEFGFATAPLIAMGCVMMRVCHLNTCPVGVATQDPELRTKFAGTPEHVINYFFFVAEEAREIMAQLGFRTVDEMVGRVDVLEMNPPEDHWKARHLDFSTILYKPEVGSEVAVRNVQPQDHGLELALDNQLIEAAKPAIEHGRKVTGEFHIRNINRTVGGMLSGRIAKRYGQSGLPEDTIRFTFRGNAGQSFGAFLSNGCTFELVGDANDYLGKGLSGGKLIVRPAEDVPFVPEENIIAGNVIAYGATSGEIYVRGVVGERFLVRNSGASAVVEGVGDHGCEYMTGGRAVIIGGTGRNFAAGMSGGIAYVYDPYDLFTAHCNTEMVDLCAMDPEEDDHETVLQLLRNHLQYTGSAVAKRLLDNWEQESIAFVKVMPRDYRRVLDQRKALKNGAGIVESGSGAASVKHTSGK